MTDSDRLLQTFLRLVRISSPSGDEGEVVEAIGQELRALGLAVERDAAGNLLARLDGPESAGEPLLLTAHMDTVRPCERVTPVIQGDVISSDGSTILGADDKAGVAIILEALRTLLEEGGPHRPIEALFTVGEESGLDGAKALAPTWLRARMGIGLDSGGDPGMMVASAPSHDTLVAAIHGRAAHAGVIPEAGVNAILVAAEAISAMPLGRVDAETTANIGIIAGGLATNIVPDLVTLHGEARSHDPAKLEAQTRAMVQALEQSAQARGATVDIRVTREYEGYRFSEGDPIIRLVSAAMRSLGLSPILHDTGGGSDANILNAAGISTVQISAGMAEAHTTREHVALSDMVAATRIVLECVRGPSR